MSTPRNFVPVLQGSGYAASPDNKRTRCGPLDIRMRSAGLKQDQFAYYEETIVNTVIMGHERLHAIMMERDVIYSKAEFTEKDGIRSGDLEAITSLNEGLMDFPEVILFASHDHQFVSTVANRIVELTPEGSIDRLMSFDDYLASAVVAKEREVHYCGRSALAL